MNIEFKFKVGDVVYARCSPGLVQHGIVESRHWSEDRAGVQIEYQVQTATWNDSFTEDVLFATAEEAFAQ